MGLSSSIRWIESFGALFGVGVISLALAVPLKAETVNLIAFIYLLLVAGLNRRFLLDARDLLQTMRSRRVG